MLSSLLRSFGCFADNLIRGQILFAVPYRSWPDEKRYIIIKTLFLFVFAIPVFVFLLIDSLVCFSIKLVGLLLSKILLITIVGPFIVGAIFSVLFFIVVKFFDILFLFFSIPDIFFAPAAVLEERTKYVSRNYAYISNGLS